MPSSALRFKRFWMRWVRAETKPEGQRRNNQAQAQHAKWLTRKPDRAPPSARHKTFKYQLQQQIKHWRGGS
jgi:hypothetical protein